MLNKNRTAYVIDILTLLFFSGLTIVAVAMHEITIFYLIYVFWWDEIIKTVSDLSRLILRKHEIEDREQFKNDIKTRFFMLFLYFVFIIICFCFMIEWNTQEGLYRNIEILLFKNVYFNISLLSFAAREIYVYSNKRLVKNNLARTVMSKGVITLHLSIILGILLWAVATKKLASLPFELQSYSTILAIVPFLTIKFLFEWSEIKAKRKEMQKPE
jgi:hypothetical protein